MIWSNSLDDPDAVFVTDTSVLINLNATGRAREILGGFRCQFVVPINVRAELEIGRDNGYSDADAIEELKAAGLISEAELTKSGQAIYISLISGTTIRTLDDGEAATIGCAIERSGIALIDERKAKRLCEEVYPELNVVGTADLLMSDPVAQILGNDGLTAALFGALRQARMRVPPEHVERVRSIIGHERAQFCTSLPKPHIKSKADKAE